MLLVSDEISQVSVTCDTASSAEPMDGLLHNLAFRSGFPSNPFPNKVTERGTTRLAEGRLVPEGCLMPALWEPGVCLFSECLGHPLRLQLGGRGCALLGKLAKRGLQRRNEKSGMQEAAVPWGHPQLSPPHLLLSCSARFLREAILPTPSSLPLLTLAWSYPKHPSMHTQTLPVVSNSV